METKPCAHCGEAFPRDSRITTEVWIARRFCSRSCAGASRRVSLGEKSCVKCGATFKQTPSQRGKLWEQRKYCSTACAYADRKGKRRGPDHWAWKGGRRVAQDGYIEVALPDEHPYASTRRNGRYVFEHRLVMAESLGRPLERHETVHHINGNRQDNRLENLQLRNGRHGKGVVYTCRVCGSHDIETRKVG